MLPARKMYSRGKDQTTYVPPEVVTVSDHAGSMRRGILRHSLISFFAVATTKASSIMKHVAVFVTQLIGISLVLAFRRR